MAELQTSSTVEPSVQEQAAVDKTDAMAQAWDDNQAALADQLEQHEGQTEDPPSRPEWLPEKFESPEAMAAAYSELEGKLGAGTAETTKTDETTETEDAPAFTAIDSATAEFMESGELSQETFDSLEKSGLPRQLVEAYIAGQQALSASQTNEIYAVAGGEEGYQQMASWATENLDESSVDAFNQIVETGSVEQARVAAQGLYAQFRAAQGGAPRLVQGSTNGQAIEPFASTAVMSQAMSDPRYKTDPAYQREVQQRLSVSDIL